MHADPPSGAARKSPGGWGRAMVSIFTAASSSSHPRAGGRPSALITMSFPPMDRGMSACRLPAKTGGTSRKADGREVYVHYRLSILHQDML
jgi:hypothetical protein